MKDIYLDTNIFVSWYMKDEFSSEIENAVEVLSGMESVRFVTSLFTFVELAKVLINQFNIKPKKVASDINRLQRSSKIYNVKFFILDTHKNSNYTFDDFWSDVGENMNLYNPGWGDAFHCVIMKNNNVKSILSRDGKDDFEIVPGINLLKPKDIKLK
ncbi:MAG: type II toxin-antitoxin system VapC family toxin [Candidatus Doudnabacteria bacterium]